MNTADALPSCRCTAPRELPLQVHVHVDPGDELLRLDAHVLRRPSLRPIRPSSRGRRQASGTARSSSCSSPEQQLSSSSSPTSRDAQNRRRLSVRPIDPAVPSRGRGPSTAIWTSTWGSWSMGAATRRHAVRLLQEAAVWRDGPVVRRPCVTAVRGGAGVVGGAGRLRRIGEALGAGCGDGVRCVSFLFP